MSNYSQPLATSDCCERMSLKLKQFVIPFLLTVASIAVATPIVVGESSSEAAARVVEPRSPTPTVEEPVSNAKRFAMGLPPLPPKRTRTRKSHAPRISSYILSKGTLGIRHLDTGELVDYGTPIQLLIEDAGGFGTILYYTNGGGNPYSSWWLSAVLPDAGETGDLGPGTYNYATIEPVFEPGYYYYPETDDQHPGVYYATLFWRYYSWISSQKIDIYWAAPESPQVPVTKYVQKFPDGTSVIRFTGDFDVLKSDPRTEGEVIGPVEFFLKDPIFY
ncbi:hypothetical protein FRB99_000112 [Tulasnella sp. 403]|nr:hypothetical protein FRB99_000112 [Tulasnella sp. 403]